MADSLKIWADIEFETKSDVSKALEELHDPFVEIYDKSSSGVLLSATSASFPENASKLEGFARPLWGIVPFVQSGGKFKHWNVLHEGLTNGSNPHHSGYWGDPEDYSQILVDSAAIGYALCFIPEHIWAPLSSDGKRYLSRYLFRVSSKKFCDNNWKFFKVLVDLGLQKVGFKTPAAEIDKCLDDLEHMYLENGWYGDGKKNRIDYYNGFAFHYYGLIYYILMKNKDIERSIRFKERAVLFAKEFIHWFADDGPCLPYGRSLTYRFAINGFWGMLAMALSDEEAPFVSWSTLKGLYMRNFTWWKQQPLMYYGSKYLIVGYSYPNYFISERYNSTQSSYWSFKAFSALQIPSSHPFWTCDATPLMLQDASLTTIGMHIQHNLNNTIALVSGPWHDEYQNEKYTKFAYSTRYGFGVISNHRTFELSNVDNMLAFSFNQKEFYVREEHKSWIFDRGLYSEWSPTRDIVVHTWIIKENGFHIRVHQIKNMTSRPVYTIEGGFALPGDKLLDLNITSLSCTIYNHAYVSSNSDESIIVDLDNKRTALVSQTEPNTNLLYSKVFLPKLKYVIPENSQEVFTCAVYAGKISNSANVEKILRNIEIPNESYLEKSKKSATRVVAN